MRHHEWWNTYNVSGHAIPAENEHENGNEQRRPLNEDHQTQEDSPEDGG